ncbi:hypothetical protein MPTK1_7g16130 [Marchantia polymorpha subsp. ruderalis]|uniref:Uncharacterized protein n=2 Tax=Marchantia polymorpha TaxID=3197 RepID=A0AAF6C074_MARPO|nr:hypothetical protein MARPO_0111s0007 [Marchantia polymorpha]BBN17658.1 hypothetical protein Mp_7g16130 [Marchantia polymorpha subsp. ruderalis]|eukprot:PTQ31446.1 hypothetical protein MARPO_0111s0007 [Marchantia polymorpha]
MPMPRLFSGGSGSSSSSSRSGIGIGSRGGAGVVVVVVQTRGRPPGGVGRGRGGGGGGRGRGRRGRARTALRRSIARSVAFLGVLRFPSVFRLRVVSLFLIGGVARGIGVREEEEGEELRFDRGEREEEEEGGGRDRGLRLLMQLRKKSGPAGYGRRGKRSSAGSEAGLLPRIELLRWCR